MSMPHCNNAITHSYQQKLTLMRDKANSQRPNSAALKEIAALLAMRSPRVGNEAGRIEDACAE